eukprot:Skav227280  [mRNA]  locus=scaffold1862:72767:83097:- [translate_table: standard]
MATRQPGEGKGKGKEGEKGEKGKGKGTKGGKGKAKGQTAAGAYQYPYGYYPYSQEQVQNAWAMHMQYYQQALQAQATQPFLQLLLPRSAVDAVEPSFWVSFVANPQGSETKSAYGRDVFVDAALLPDIEVKAKAWGRRPWHSAAVR